MLPEIEELKNLIRNITGEIIDLTQEVQSIREINTQQFHYILDTTERFKEVCHTKRIQESLYIKLFICFFIIVFIFLSIIYIIQLINSWQGIRKKIVTKSENKKKK